MFKSKEKDAVDKLKKALTAFCDLYEHRQHATDITISLESTCFDLHLKLEYPDPKLLDELIAMSEQLQKEDMAEEVTEEEYHALAVAEETNPRTKSN